MTDGTKNRRVYLDALRIIACFLVIVNHTNSRIFLGTEPSPLWFTSLSWFFISKTAVPIFIMISGALLLPKEESYKKTLLRALRILIVIVVFTGVYFVWQYLRGERVFDVTEYLRAAYTTSATNAYWYLYLYLALLVMLPILRKLVRNMRDCDYLYFFFWSLLFLGVFPIIVHYVPALQYNSAFILPLFNSYLGLLLAGNYVNKRLNANRVCCVIAVLIFIVCTAASVLLTFSEYRRDSGVYLFYDNRVFLTITLASISLFYIVKCLFSRAEGKKHVVLQAVGRCTFGIYLLSDLFIKELEPVYDMLTASIPVFPAMLLYELCVFVCGFVVAFVLTRIPLIKKLI